MFKWMSVVWKNLVPGESPVRLWLPPHTELSHLPPISHQAGAVLSLSHELWGSKVKLKIELCSQCIHVSSVIQARPDAVQRWYPSKSEVGEKWPGTEEVDCDISRGELSCGLWRSCVREPGARTPPPSNVQLVGAIKWGGYEDKNTKTKTKTSANTGQAWRRFCECHASGLCPLVMWSPGKPKEEGEYLGESPLPGVIFGSDDVVNWELRSMSPPSPPARGGVPWRDKVYGRRSLPLSPTGGRRTSARGRGRRRVSKKWFF